jgi:uncharacterized protein (DUF2336 family)
MDPENISQIGHDVDALLCFTARKATSNRAVLVSIGEALFDDVEEVLSDHERELMSNALKVLVRELEDSIRRELTAGAGVSRKLAESFERHGRDIAYPILAGAGLLRADELIEAVKHRVQTHRLVLALKHLRRQAASTNRNREQDDSVIQSLLREPSCQTLESLKHNLAAESGRVDTFQNPRIRPIDLPAEVSPRLWWWVSAALRKHATEHEPIDPRELDDAIELATLGILARIEDAQGRLDEANAVIDGMTAIGRFSPDALQPLLRQGEVPLFEAAFARATGLRPRLVSRLLYEPGGESLAVACKAIGFDREVYAAIFDCTRHALLLIEAPSYDRQATGVNELFNLIDSDTAAAVLDRWRRDTGFLYALKQIEPGS